MPALPTVAVGSSPAQKPSFATDVALRLMKMVDIGYIAVIYFVFAYAIAIGLDAVLGPFDLAANENKSRVRIFAELMGQCWLFGVITYIARNLVELIPFPFDGVLGFNHRAVKELGGAAVFSMILLWNSHNFIAKMEYLYTRVTGSASKKKTTRRSE